MAPVELVDGEAIQWLVGMAIGLAALSVLFRNQARPPRCARCRVPLVASTSTMLSGRPPVMETIYECPRCPGVVEECIVGAWD